MRSRRSWPDCGLELLRASLPAAPSNRVAGQPSTRVSGGTSRGARIEIPMNNATAPSPTNSRRRPVERPLANRPTSSAATATSTVPTAAGWLKRANLDGGSRAPSRTAAIGGTRVARSAGRSAARSVIPTPTTSEITIVRVLNTVPVCGRSIPNETSRLLSPLASPSPRNSPTTEATRPITKASIITDVRTWRRVAPSVRSVASSRVRCAIVIERVLAITKLPTNRAIPPNASRKSWKMVINPLVSLVCWAACPCPVLTWLFGGSSGRIVRTSWAGETPCVAATLI